MVDSIPEVVSINVYKYSTLRSYTIVSLVVCTFDQYGHTERERERLRREHREKASEST